MGDKVGENPAALRAAVFLLSAKNRRGGGVFKHPPSRAKVKVGWSLKRALIAGHYPPRSTDVSLSLARPLPPTAGNPSQEQIASAEVARTGLSLPFSSAVQHYKCPTEPQGRALFFFVNFSLDTLIQKQS